MSNARARCLLPVAVVALALTACGSDPAPTKAGSAKAGSFGLDEWSITGPSATITAGKVEVTATNRGSEVHELVIVRASEIASLPTKSDGSVDEDKIPESKKAGELADLAAGATASRTLDLPAGDYVAICNIVDQMGNDGNMGNSTHMGNGGDMGNGTNRGANGMGHIHFQLGMATRFTVT